MPRSFSSTLAATDRLSLAASGHPVTGLTSGVSFSCWMRASTLTPSDRRGIISTWYQPTGSGTDNNAILLRINNAGDDLEAFVRLGGTTRGPDTITGAIADTNWRQVGLCYDPGGPTIYAVNNGTLGTGAAASGTFGTNSSALYLGLFYQPGTPAVFDRPLSGDMAHAALWSVPLTAAEWASLADGVSPLLVRPASLMTYWPLWGNSSPEMDFVGSYNLTVSGPTKSTTDPRIYRPGRRRSFVVVASPDGTAVGSAAGTSSVTGVSKARKASVGSAAGTGTATGVSGLNSPLDIASTVLWLDPGSLSLSDGNAVSAWADETSNNNDASQGTGALQPVYRDGTDRHHGRPMVEFNDDQLLVADDASLSNGQVTYTAVVDVTDFAGSDDGWILNKSATNSATTGLRCLGDPTGFDGGVRLAASTATFREVTDDVNYEQGAVILMLIYDGSTLSLYVENKLVDSLSVSGAVDTASGNLSIGNHPTSTTAGLVGRIGDVVVSDEALSDTDRTRLYEWLRDKYPLPTTRQGLATGLSSVAIRSCSIARDDTNSQFVMAYVGNAGNVYYATAPYSDPNNWTDSATQILAGANIRGTCLLKVGSTWYLYYDNASTGTINVATGSTITTLSASGSNPILSGTGTGNEQYVRHPYVIEESGSWVMLYDGRNGTATSGVGALYRATSSDGISWSRDAVVLTQDGEGFEDTDINAPSLLKVGNQYWLAYGGFNADGPDSRGDATHQFRLARSTGTSSWTRDPLDPWPLHHRQSEDKFVQGNPELHYHNNTLWVYYEIENSSAAPRQAWLKLAEGVGPIEGVGSASGSSTATGVGKSKFTAVGSASGTSTVTGVSTSGASIGSASGTSTVTGVGKSKFTAAGAASGTSSVAGVGAASKSSVGAASGTSSATGVGKALKVSVGASSGVAVATGVSAAQKVAVGSASGVATVTGVGDSVAAGTAIGSSQGTSTASGVSKADKVSVGASSGVASVSGVGKASVTAVGSSSGTSSATGVSAAQKVAVGSASGTATVSGVGDSLSESGSVGSSSGLATVVGVGKARKVSVGAASGTSTATGVGSSLGGALDEVDNPAHVFRIDERKTKFWIDERKTKFWIKER